LTERTDLRLVVVCWLEPPEPPEPPELPELLELPELPEPPLEDEDLEGFAADGEVFGPAVPSPAAFAVVDGLAAELTESPLGGAFVPDVVGEAKESRPGPLSVFALVAGGADARPGVLWVTAIAVTQATTVVIAIVPASQSLRVPGAREVSEAQPFSQAGRGGGWGVVSGMPISSSGAKAAAAGGVKVR
jgi:hypothetical protein